MNTLLCAGGSSTKVLEAVLHLCAAGLGPDNFKVLLIDPDASNATTSRIKKLLVNYEECRTHFWKDQRQGEGPNLFHTEVDLLDTPEEAGLKIWSPVKGTNTLEELLNCGNLDTVSLDATKLFFTSDELKMDLDVGFKGHTAIGAAAMTLINQPKHAGEQPWLQLCEKIRKDVSKPEGARVFFAASIFGGTGASAIFPIVRFLKTVPKVGNEDKLRIAIGAIVPYFSFTASEEGEGTQADEMAAKSEYFLLRTRAAVEFYDQLRDNDDWPFHSVYWIGDDQAVNYRYGEGGPEQDNPAHFADLLLALTCLQYWEYPGERTRDSSFCGPRQDVESSLGRQNLVAWEDIPLIRPDKIIRETIRRRLLRLFMAGVAHLGFFDDLLSNYSIDSTPYCVPWYYDRFASRSNWFASQDNESVKLLSQFFRTYHFPWWSQVLAHPHVRLLNRAAIRMPEVNSAEVDLNRIANLLWPDRAAAGRPEHFDRFFTEMCKVNLGVGGKEGTGAYLALLIHAADEYIDRVYEKKPKGRAKSREVRNA